MTLVKIQPKKRNRVVVPEVDADGYFAIAGVGWRYNSQNHSGFRSISEWASGNRTDTSASKSNSLVSNQVGTEEIQIRCKKNSYASVRAALLPYLNVNTFGATISVAVSTGYGTTTVKVTSTRPAAPLNVTISQVQS